jgi:hypothetical protein
VLKYLYSISEYGISFHSTAHQTLQAFNHFPHHHDKEAYTDAIPPSPAECHNLAAFSDACWGGQFGNAVADGIPLKLFKYRALSGYIICCCAKPSGKIKKPTVRALLKSMISLVLSIAQLTSVSPKPPSASPSTTITRPPVIGHHQSPSKAQNTSTYMKIVSARTTKTELCSLSTFLASSMPAISFPRRLKMTPTSVAVATPSWCQEVIL